jgi:hypothetical protein
MDVATPSHAVAAFASFVRERLAEVGGTLAPLWTRREGAEVAMVIIGASAPFAPTSHARARLLRQAHASGVLRAREGEQAGLAEQAGQPRSISGAVGSTGGTGGSGADLFGASG